MWYSPTTGPEGERLVEQHDVDHRAGEALRGAGEPGIAADVLEAAPLMAQRTHQFELDPLHELGDGVVRADGDPQRARR